MTTNTCIFGVVHPVSLPFLAPFARSIDGHRWPLCLLVDGVPLETVRSQCAEIGIRHARLIPAPPRPTISKNRSHGLTTCLKSGFKKIILADIDDLYTPNRVDIVSQRLDTHPVIINDLSVVDTNGHLLIADCLAKRHLHGSQSLNSLIHRNYAGMGNTALHGDLLRQILPIPDDIIATDWFIALSAAIIATRVDVLAHTFTLYRQHPNNIIGMGHTTTPAKIRLGITVKQQIYDAISARFPRNKKIHAILTPLQRALQTLSTTLSDPIHETQYCHQVTQTLASYPVSLWWEDVMFFQ